LENVLIATDVFDFSPGDSLEVNVVARFFHGGFIAAALQNVHRRGFA
jgi:hypothetical protein